jgi:hypothetical protein
VVPTCVRSISRSFSRAEAETSSFDKNNGFVATICIAIDDPTLLTASRRVLLSSASSVTNPAIRPIPEATKKNAKELSELQNEQMHHSCWKKKEEKGALIFSKVSKQPKRACKLGEFSNY